jgi:hypothetical protein
MAFDVRTGLSGAASGAGIGSSFGPLGTAIGAVGGLATGFFGGDGGSDTADRLARENEQLLSMLEQRFENVSAEDPLDTAAFGAQFSAAQEQAERQQERDTQAAAARGLVGSQFEIAQQGNRAGALAESTRSAAAQAERAQRQEEQSALSRLLQQRANLNRIRSGQAQREAQREQQQASLVGSSFANLASILNRPDRGQERTDQQGIFSGMAQRGFLT